VQQKNDGTHAILPVATHLTCNVDHVGVPVMWLRHSHGKMRRDGFPAALMQHVRPVDERGRVHGAPGLAAVVAHRVQAWRRGPCRRKERKREWVRSSRRHDRLRVQDKANWRSRTRCRWTIEKPLSAHWFLEVLGLALDDIQHSPAGALVAYRGISMLEAIALADLRFGRLLRTLFDFIRLSATLCDRCLASLAWDVRDEDC
jgi:hypothetical protein